MVGNDSGVSSKENAPPKPPQATNQKPSPDNKDEEPKISDGARARAEQAQEALDRWGIFGDKDKEDNSDPAQELPSSTIEQSAEAATLKRRKLVGGCLLMLSAALIAAGVILQVSKRSPEKKVAFRWCYFVAGIYPLYLFSAWFMTYLIRTIEVMFFQEFLAHLETLKNAWRLSLFWALVLVLQRCVFVWLFCWGSYSGTCSDATYQRVSFIYSMESNSPATNLLDNEAN